MVKIEYDEEDGCITEETSVRLKRAFKDYYEINGVPDMAEDIVDAELRKLAMTYEEEFGESADEFERDKSLVVSALKP